MLVVGNWKLNTTQAEAVSLAADVARGVSDANSGVGVGICPPYVWLEAVVERTAGSPVRVGAQNVAAQDGGAYTGEVSAAMLAEVGCTYAIVGHSERRALFGDTDEVVAAKVSQALANGLTPIVCVGETLDERKAGRVEDVVTGQLAGSLAGVESLERIVVAYEPVWAIGTGETATPDQAQDVHATIRSWLRDRFGASAAQTPLLYGGSVKPANALELFRQPDVDGGLVGGASLDAESFVAIVHAAADAEG
ncbi:MAG TPA: triose-phosphate isomerase [Bacteroidetes bacterium]|nr:triose-phosphate isomerase [Bacteroidota bacterium]HIL58814.1 triose-phosphate isomerase [Rhodothermales bacterium]